MSTTRKEEFGGPRWLPVVSLSQNHLSPSHVIEGSHDRVAKEFHELVKPYKGNPSSVFRLIVRPRTYSLEVVLWDPYTCQGQCFPTIRLQFLHRQVDPEATEWTRKPLAYENNLMEDAYACLFDIVLSVGMEPLQIGVLDHDVVATVLARKLHPANRNMKRIEINASGGIGNRNIDRLLHVLVQPSSSLETILLEGLDSFSSDCVALLFQSLKNKPRLQNLYLQRERHIHTWQRECKRLSGDETGISLIPLISTLKNDSALNIRTIDLSGNPLSHPCELFATALVPHQHHHDKSLVGLERLFLRDTGLKEPALMELFRQLGNQDCTLVTLDVSHNRFSRAVMKQLVVSLQTNRTLERLSAEHCGIDREQVTYLANGLSQCQGLRHLFLNGNEFTWDLPLLLVPPEEGATRIAVGASIMVDAVEHNNSLQTLEMGEYGNVLPVGRVCCTGPTYASFFDEKRLGGYLQRNLEAYHEYRRVRLRESVIKIVILILGKLKEETLDANDCDKDNTQAGSKAAKQENSWEA